MIDPETRAKKEEQARKILAKARDAQARAAKATTEDDRKHAENEAQTFFAAAGHLMWRYSLDRAAVEREENGGTSKITISSMWFHVPRTGGYGPERVYAVWSFLPPFDCQGVAFNMTRTDRWNEPIRMEIFGPDDVLPDVRLLLPNLLLQADESGRQAAKRRRAQLDGCIDHRDVRKEVITYRRAFIHGYGAGAAQLFTARRRETETEIRGTGAELVLRDRAQLVEAEVARRHPDVANITPEVTDDRGFADGVSAGYSADFGNRSIAREVKAIDA